MNLKEIVMKNQMTKKHYVISFSFEEPELTNLSDGKTVKVIYKKNVFELKKIGDLFEQKTNG